MAPSILGMVFFGEREEVEENVRISHLPATTLGFLGSGGWEQRKILSDTIQVRFAAIQGVEREGPRERCLWCIGASNSPWNN
jgi:hypothetical protein